MYPLLLQPWCTKGKTPTLSSDMLDDRYTLININNCRKLITTDVEGKPILDIMGEGVKSLPNIAIPQLVRDAYNFVIKQEKYFTESGDHHLLERYS